MGDGGSGENPTQQGELEKSSTALCNPISLTDGNPRSSTDKKPILPRKHPWNCSSATKFSQQSPGSRHKGSGRQQALLPPGHQTRNTVNSTFLTWSSHRHTCCYMHLHTHSLGNIAVGTFKKLTEEHSPIVMNATCFTTGPGWLKPDIQLDRNEETFHREVNQK